MSYESNKGRKVTILMLLIKVYYDGIFFSPFVKRNPFTGSHLNDADSNICTTTENLLHSRLKFHFL